MNRYDPRLHSMMLILAMLSTTDWQINGKVKVLLGEGKAEDVKAGVEEDPDADVAIACPLCGAMFDMRTGESPEGCSLVPARPESSC